MYRGCPSRNCPWKGAIQLGQGEGPIGLVGPIAQPRGTNDTASKKRVVFVTFFREFAVLDACDTIPVFPEFHLLKEVNFMELHEKAFATNVSQRRLRAEPVEKVAIGMAGEKKQKTCWLLKCV